MFRNIIPFPLVSQAGENGSFFYFNSPFFAQKLFFTPHTAKVDLRAHTKLLPFVRSPANCAFKTLRLKEDWLNLWKIVRANSKKCTKNTWHEPFKKPRALTIKSA